MKDQLILLLETATTTCSVALAQNGSIIALKEVNERNIHASHITLFIEEVMLAAKKKYSDLQAISISKGPGSYTGLRIGVSTAKGLCYALDIPLIGIDTIEAMAFGFTESFNIPDSSLLIPMLDARRMEVYTGIYRNDLSVIESVSAKIVDKDSFNEYNDQSLFLFGDGADKFRALFADQPQINFIDFSTSASHLNALALKKFRNSDFENLAYFEPFYLKDFLLTTSKKGNF
ncbi:MAG: tRNA (adenosine(37)-N6)-threonylcarbamoyltransferase complex dimerization subunit type 1 TsaB [Bacteroidetes bacterium]|jgi:tRNA threonylcarbamoyladenosine biosynthesis protein TsaB|uniref:tRNA (adenosine(37)-N6)-threonylcarbamoyltransferase complex dimerization subunit type 1 TsaB n=1 Tax=Daejeonella sp. TaxID=2805397 RepID=UPI00404AC695|nr:tRNA (adenosine(37)-N6)-threonylcarbamoyltransferase complex dimerization subunit type 1 TsaB [Bacteroidota bacterium]